MQLLETAAWEDELRPEPVGQPAPFAEWLELLAAEDLPVYRLPAAVLAGGPYDRGEVVAVHAPRRMYFALPRGALALLGDRLLPD